MIIRIPSITYRETSEFVMPSMLAAQIRTLALILLSADELARLDDQAAGYKQLMKDKIVHAPVSNIGKMLDIGCGTGIVTRDIASRFPNATVYGIDISPVPPFSATPPNVKYIQNDIKKLAKSNDEPIKEGTIDYIYQRLLVCGMTEWPEYIRQMTTLLKPGGWIEVHDYAELWYKLDSSAEIGQDWRWQQAMRRGARQLGLDLDVGLNARKYMEDAGLVDIHVEKYLVPYGTWMVKDRPETAKIGEHQATGMGPVFSNSILPGVTRKLGLGNEELEGLKEECRRTLRAEEGKYWWFYATWGRKA